MRSSCQVLGDLSVSPDLDSEHINGHLNSPIIYRTEKLTVFARNYKEWQARDKCSMHSVSICGGKYTDGGLLLIRHLIRTYCAPGTVQSSEGRDDEARLLSA